MSKKLERCYNNIMLVQELLDVGIQAKSSNTGPVGGT